MTNLTSIFGLNEYCGPGVLSALTGKSTDECAAVISQISGKRVIKAVEVDHLIQACRRLGMIVEAVKVPSVTLFGCLASLRDKQGCYLVTVPSHVVAIEITADGIYFIDNHTKTAINAAASARLSQKVINIFSVKPKTKEQINEERKKWILSQIDRVNDRIELLQREKESYIEDLRRLENE